MGTNSKKQEFYEFIQKTSIDDDLLCNSYNINVAEYMRNILLLGDSITFLLVTLIKSSGKKPPKTSMSGSILNKKEYKFFHTHSKIIIDRANYFIQ